VVNCKGKIEVNVKHFGQAKRIWLHVFGASEFALLGKDWLGELQVNWQAIKSVVSSSINGTTSYDILKVNAC